MKENKENTLASAELRDMINHAMINKRNSEADEDLKSSIAKAMDKKTSTGKIPSAEHSKNSDSIHTEPKIKAEKKKRFPINMRGGWSLRKKTGVTLGFIFLALVLLMAVIVFLFFHYTGMLKDRDDSIRTEKPPVDSRDLVDEPDTLDEKAKEKELREMLQQRSKKISNEKVMNI
ncbi:MAG: LytR family transcriptional regulator, partial [Ruminococcus sp.]|nr:LytR family transcriptional regulator [Ruminococcus sp.]